MGVLKITRNDCTELRIISVIRNLLVFQEWVKWLIASEHAEKAMETLSQVGCLGLRILPSIS